MDHLDALSESPSIFNSFADSPGTKDTSNLSNGRDKPSPIALMKASLRVQQLKNASFFLPLGIEQKTAFSPDEKKL